jgi:hypothetical protein
VKLSVKKLGKFFIKRVAGPCQAQMGLQKIGHLRLKSRVMFTATACGHIDWRANLYKMVPVLSFFIF